ncbi:pilus assembly protein, partial [Jeotgalicoccus huakuii]|nr:pilus assembly protein [Jeotgalicoccus huakuii]
AIVSALMFTLLFGVLEIGRLYYTVNVLNESVRRGARLAAVCNISDPVVLRRAIFNTAGDSGASSLLADLDTSDLTLRYLDKNGAQVANPG